MSDELKVEYTVKEIVHLMSDKIDKLDGKFDRFAESMETRVSGIEAQQISAHTLAEFKTQAEQNASKIRFGIYGLLLTGLGVIGDAVLHFVGKR